MTIWDLLTYFVVWGFGGIMCGIPCFFLGKLAQRVSTMKAQLKQQSASLPS